MNPPQQIQRYESSLQIVLITLTTRAPRSEGRRKIPPYFHEKTTSLPVGLIYHPRSLTARKLNPREIDIRFSFMRGIVTNPKHPFVPSHAGI